MEPLRTVSLYLLFTLCSFALTAQDNKELKLSGDTFLLNEVVVKPRLIERIATLQIQRIGSYELSRAACCSLAESFETNPSVDVSYSDAITGAKQIRLLGLDGSYVQLLTENYPNFNGLASTYGLDQVPGPWMESIYVSKGTSSVKNGYEALTGQINVEYKKPPASDILTANVFAADNGRMEANTDLALFLTPKLSTGLFLHYSQEQSVHDQNNDGFMDTPLKRQVNLMNRWYYRSEKLISQLGVQYVTDEREGGQTDDALSIPTTRRLYRTTIDMNRLSFFTKNGLTLDADKDESVALIFTGSTHEQESAFGARPYDAEQQNLYASLLYERNLADNHRISTGLSMNHDRFDETVFRQLVGPYHERVFHSNDSETTMGAYGEYTLTTNRLNLLAGVRADHSSLFGLFVTPRLHVKYDYTDWGHIRATAGKGYRTAHVWAENNYLLSSNRSLSFPEKPLQEEAWNFGVSLGFFIPINGEDLTINGEWYYTDFRQQLIVDMDSDPNQLAFYPLDGKSYSSVFQVEASYPFFRGFTLTGAYRWMDVKETYNGVLNEKPLVSKYKALATASYHTPLRKWQFDLTAQFNGGGRMPQPDTTPLWESNFPAYTIINAQISKFFRDWSVYAGAENLLNFVQKDRIIGWQSPWNSGFDATMVWGPAHGRTLYIGLRYALQR